MPKATAIELTDSDARVVQLNVSRKLGVQAEAAFVVSFAGFSKDQDDSAARAAHLKSALKEHGLKPQSSVMIVPKKSATVRRVRLPSSDPAELESMARFEAEKIIPFNVERHIVSHSILSDQGLEGTDVMLAAVDEPVMAPWLDTVRGAGLDPEFATVASLSLQYGYFDTVSEEHRDACQAIIQIGWTHTDISIFHDGQMVTTRSILLGVRNLLKELNLESEGAASSGTGRLLNQIDALPGAGRNEEADRDSGSEEGFEIFHDRPTNSANPAVDAWVRKVITNIQRTHEFALREYAVPPAARLVLTGEGALIAHLDRAIQNNLGVPVEIYNPLSTIDKTRPDHIDTEFSPGFACAYGAALMLAREEHRSSINLLPGSLLHQRRQSELMIHYAATGFMALTAGLVLFLYFWTSGNHRGEQLERYDKYAEELNVLVNDVDDMKERMKIIREIRSERAGVLQILEGISQYENLGSTPEGKVALTDFEFILGEEVTVSGHALEIQDINDFLYYLRNLRNERGQEMFEEIDIRNQNPTRLPRRDRTIYEFQLSCLLAED